MIVFTEQAAMTEKSFGQHILAGNNSIHDQSFDRIRTAEDERILDMAQGKIEFSLKDIGNSTVNNVSKNSEEFIVQNTVTSSKATSLPERLPISQSKISKDEETSKLYS
jgi:hypothetical protein